MLKSGESEQKACGSSLSYSWNSSLSIIISKWSKKKKNQWEGQEEICFCVCVSQGLLMNYLCDKWIFVCYIAGSKLSRGSS